MKLLFCERCGDLRKVHRKKTVCACKSCYAKYLEDGLTVIYSEGAQIFGVNNDALRELTTQPGMAAHLLDPIELFRIREGDNIYRND